MQITWMLSIAAAIISLFVIIDRFLPMRQSRELLMEKYGIHESRRRGHHEARFKTQHFDFRVDMGTNNSFNVGDTIIVSHTPFLKIFRQLELNGIPLNSHRQLMILSLAVFIIISAYVGIRSRYQEDVKSKARIAAMVMGACLLFLLCVPESIIKNVLY